MYDGHPSRVPDFVIGADARTVNAK